jgi:hypothetical protein
MKKIISYFTASDEADEDVTVRLVGTTLVASFKNSEPVTLWHYDLEQNHSFSLALTERGGKWHLLLVEVNGDQKTIAEFPSRRDAEKALQSVQQALLSEGRGDWLSLLKPLGMLFVVIAVVYLLFSAMGWIFDDKPEKSSPIAPTTVTTTKEKAGQSSTELPQGVPLSADDILKPEEPK